MSSICGDSGASGDFGDRSVLCLAGLWDRLDHDRLMEALTRAAYAALRFHAHVPALVQM